jgi:hypothetical protein
MLAATLEEQKPAILILIDLNMFMRHLPQQHIKIGFAFGRYPQRLSAVVAAFGARAEATFGLRCVLRCWLVIAQMLYRVVLTTAT